MRFQNVHYMIEATKNGNRRSSPPETRHLSTGFTFA